jgi:RNA polymerase sigma-70 factor (ECF subfamily)
LAAGQSQSPDDLSLMRAIAAGDRAAFSLLYERHGPMLMAICRRVIKDSGAAEDILIDVFLEVWLRADRFDPSRGTPLTYLVTLARSRAIDGQRAQAARLRATSGDSHNDGQASPASDPSQSVDSNEQRQIVRTALAELEPAQRQALECAFYEGLSHSEIAEKLQKPLGTVKTYIRQGLIRLRDSLRTTNEKGSKDRP